jgi:hypothetical protein
LAKLGQRWKTIASQSNYHFSATAKVDSFDLKLTPKTQTSIRWQYQIWEPPMKQKHTSFCLKIDPADIFTHPYFAMKGGTAINLFEACTKSGHMVSDHFVGITEMVGIGSGAQRELED